MENLKNYLNCSINSNEKLIVFKDKRTPRKLIIENKSKLNIIKITIDGGLLPQSIQKCDFMLYIPKGCMHKEIYIELKGSNIKHAVDQIRSTINYLIKNTYSIQKKNKRKGYIIGSRIPSADTSVQKHKINMKKEYNLELIVKTGIFTDTI